MDIPLFEIFNDFLGFLSLKELGFIQSLKSMHKSL